MIRLLDCTLRDGGYINNWDFGAENIKKIIKKLAEAKVDIIECGYVSSKEKENRESTMFASFAQIDALLSDMPDYNYVCMINYGDYEIEKIPDRKESRISGIRLAFHKNKWKEAVAYAEKICEKGYEVYIQPMVSLSYEDAEFVELISKANQIKAVAFYIVDSFGVMKQFDLMRLFYLVTHNLDQKIQLGYHSHNNLQMAFANAQTVVKAAETRNVIIDASIMGMGRGAGNLNTELFIEHLNETKGSKYNIAPILQAIDEVINRIYQLKGWGYSLPHYLSASWNCHPNYSTFLEGKNTLTVVDINSILSKLEEEKRFHYDKAYIQKLYEQYQSHKVQDAKIMEELEKKFQGKEILLLAPGGSILDEQEKIKMYIETENPIVISVNFVSDKIKSDFAFYSNIRRYAERKHIKSCEEIVTSNIEEASADTAYVVNYADLLNEHPAIKDNAGMMLLKLLIKLKAQKIYLAGLDGYSNDVTVDYAEKSMVLVTDIELLKTMNWEMSKMLEELSKDVEMEFLTKPRKIKFGGESSHESRRSSSNEIK